MVCDTDLTNRRDPRPGMFFFCNDRCREEQERRDEEYFARRAKEYAELEASWASEPKTIIGEMIPISKDKTKKDKRANPKKRRRKLKSTNSGIRIRQLTEPSSELKRRTYTCSLCNEKGHNARTCKKRK
jgi:hypothetical protein